MPSKEHVFDVPEMPPKRLRRMASSEHLESQVSQWSLGSMCWICLFVLVFFIFFGDLDVLEICQVMPDVAARLAGGGTGAPTQACRRCSFYPLCRDYAVSCLGHLIWNMPGC